MKAVFAALALLLAAGPAIGQEPAASAAALRDRALADDTAWRLVEDLTVTVGPRQTGTPAMEKARDWAIAQFTAMGFTNVRAEPFEAQAWLRGPESVEVVSPFPRQLDLLGLGRSIPTPPEGITAPIRIFETYKALLAAPEGSLAGMIAVVNEPMTPQNGGYGAMTPARRNGASEAARRGAVAYLIRSLSFDDGPAPHTGAMNYAPDAPRIPAAALSPPDANLLSRMAARGQPVVVKLKLASTFVEKAPAWNVVGEIRGQSAPDEVVLIGAHLDSWDVSGPVDDGSGVAVVMAAARLVGDLKPRRTIRVVLFGAEEMDYSGPAYAAAHKDEAGSLIVASEADSGVGGAFELGLPAGWGDKPQLAAVPALMAPLKIAIAAQPATGSGADTRPLHALGVPAFSFRQDMNGYFAWHHSRDDTLEKIDPAMLRQTVAAWTTLVHLIASTDVDFRSGPRKER